eukprot:CAMPEP_0115577338 /NCGR_PEP_ID=MMETSP0272-20121206/3021_1 /TAXON_ID=71861 /ORGANISM="Scrippsiella trochoidea, Strain CCMP3099" /LENGTH=1143 /DNA_ID=CAMNT_0003012147 /DNA_START=42 /DNA_END=3472 /DNA_ORIENTATION=+
MQMLAEIYSILLGMMPIAQEFYLFCFFCLGFFVFRTQAVRRLLLCGSCFLPGFGTPDSFGKHKGIETPSSCSWCSIEQLRSDFAHRRYEQVLEGWAKLEKYSGEALTLVVSALLALGRPEDIGLFVAKAAANLPHLRATLHETIACIAAAPALSVPRPHIAAALRDIFENARDKLDGRAVEALLVAFAQHDDEQRVGVLLRSLTARGEAATAEALADLVQSFVMCKNLDAALGYLEQALSAVATPACTAAAIVGSTAGAAAAALHDAATAVARMATAVDNEGLEDVPERSRNEGSSCSTRSRAWDVLELLEATSSTAAAPMEAVVVLLEFAARRPRCPDFALASRAEQLLRRWAGPRAFLPAGAYDALVRVHATCDGSQDKAFACFDELATLGESGSKSPTEGSLVGMLSVCADSKNADLAEHVLSWASNRGRCTLPVFAAAGKVLAASKKPAELCAAYEALEQQGSGPELDDAAYGQLIRCAVQAGRLELARRLFRESENPDAQNSASLIRACGQEGDVSQALTLLNDLHSRGEADVTAFNTALDVAVSVGDEQAVEKIFQEMKASDRLDAVSFNILLKQFVGANNAAERSSALLAEMRSQGVRPNVATYNSLLGGSLSVGDFARAWQIIDEMEAGPGLDAYTLSILFKSYKSRRREMDIVSFDRALALLEKYSIRVDEVLVNAALEACFGLRDSERLSNTLATMRRRGWTLPKQAGMHTYGTLIKAYGMTRQLNMAWKLWEEATCKRGMVPSEQMYSQMIDVLVCNGRLEDALGLFEEMKATHGANGFSSQGFAVAYAMVVRGFAQRKECARSLEFYEEMKAGGVKVGLVVFNTLIDACSRVGDMSSAARLFRDMVGAECVPDIITYSTLIKGYCVRGEVDEALELFSLMRKKGIKPDAIVFNSLLDGCAKKQMPELCEQVIRDMVEAGVMPSNHSASILIKLYGRCRDVQAAFRVMEELPRKYGFKPNAAVYTCLMATCSANGRFDLALDLRTRMAKAGVPRDEKTYSTLLRGALRAGSAEGCASLLRAALEEMEGGGAPRRLLDEDLVQSALALMQKKRAWLDHGRDLFERLRASGVAVRSPAATGGTNGGVGAGADAGNPAGAKQHLYGGCNREFKDMRASHQGQHHHEAGAADPWDD